MDKILRLTLLLDFYEKLLTEKQSTVFELYYLNDLSLNEIAETWGVTPQSVRDLLRRTEKILENYESKLKLVEKHLIHERKFRELMDNMEILKKQMKKEPEYVDIIEEMEIKLMELDSIDSM